MLFLQKQESSVFFTCIFHHRKVHVRGTFPSVVIGNLYCHKPLAEAGCFVAIDKKCRGCPTGAFGYDRIFASVVQNR